MTTQGAIFTIGHSTHPLEKFLSLLLKHEVSVVADVRSSPYSRFNPHFNKDTLARSLKENGIKYVFMGNEFGARADDPSCYINGRVKYSLLAKRTQFREGIERLKQGVDDHRIALMCAEREPLECHRTLLVAQALVAEGMTVKHIHSDGRFEQHQDALERLLDVVGLPHEDLFRTKEELMAEALAQQEERIAYKDESQTNDEPGASQ